MNAQIVDQEDVAEAIREGRELRPASSYRVQVAKNDLNFHPALILDPVPLGRQILSAAGMDVGEDWSLFAVTPSGDFEDVRLDEPFDLRGLGAERFIAFSTDRDFRLIVNGNQVTWGKPVISGSVLYALAEVDDQHAVFLDVPGGTDRIVARDELIDLNGPGVERFIVAPKPDLSFEIFVNSRPFVVRSKNVSFEQAVELAYPGPNNPNTRFTATYRHAASLPHAGELSAGQSVEVKQTGTRFNVRRTVQS